MTKHRKIHGGGGLCDLLIVTLHNISEEGVVLWH